MGGKSSPPPPPDYTPIAQASEKSAEYAFKLGQDQLKWAKSQYKQDRQISDRVIASMLETQDISNDQAVEDRAFYERFYRPLEQDLARDARDYASGERIGMEVGRAQGQVAAQFEQQRRAAVQNLEAFGVDPTSTRYGALDIGVRAQEGAAAAAAGNQAIQQTEAIGRALRSEAINVGRGYPGQVAQTYGTALTAGQGAVNSGLATTASGANTMGTGIQWQGMGNNALNLWGNTLNMQYQNQLDAYEAENSQSSGWGSALGMIGGAAIKMLEEGGAVEAGLPAEGTPGGAIPVDASPSGGAIPDDVPARLTEGEFVVPRDVAAWKGEEFFQKMIENSRKAKEQAVAKPAVAIAPPEDPNFVSRPQGALF